MSSRSEETTVVIGLGSNIAPELHLPAAVVELARRLRVEAVSRVWESAPVGAPASPWFLNAAVRARTALSPERLKAEVLRPIEAAAGRVRSADRCAPRTLDLDIVLYGCRVVNEPRCGLHIPDPDLDRRAHVAMPTVEVWPDAVHPVTGAPLAEVARRLASGASMIDREDVDLTAAWRQGNPGPGGA